MQRGAFQNIHQIELTKITSLDYEFYIHIQKQIGILIKLNYICIYIKYNSGINMAELQSELNGMMIRIFQDILTCPFWKKKKKVKKRKAALNSIYITLLKHGIELLFDNQYQLQYIHWLELYQKIVSLWIGEYMATQEHGVSLHWLQ